MYLIILGVLEVNAFCTVVEPVTYLRISINKIQQLKCLIWMLTS